MTDLAEFLVALATGLPEGAGSPHLGVEIRVERVDLTVPFESNPRLSPIWTPNGTTSRTFIESNR